MIRVLCAAAVTTIAVSSPTLQPSADHARGEPPLQIMLEIDGVELPIIDGQRIEVTIGERKVPVTARVLPTRRFAEHGVQFEFPRDMGYEFDPSGGVDTWTLDGSNCTLILNSYEFGGAAELVDAVIEATATGMGGNAKKARPVEWRLGTITAKGRTLAVEAMGTPMQITVLGIENEDASLVLIVQDVLGEQGEMSDESRRVRELLSESFALGQ